MKRREFVSRLSIGGGALISTSSLVRTASAWAEQTGTRASAMPEVDIKNPTAFLDLHLGRGRWSVVPDGATSINMPTSSSYELHLVTITLQFLKLADLIALPASAISLFEVHSLEHIYRDNSSEVDRLIPRFIAKYRLNPQQVPELLFRYRAISTFADLIVIASDSSRSKFYVAIRHVKHPIWSGPKYDGA